MSDYEDLGMFIDGEWTAGSSGERQAVLDPATEEVLAELPLAGAADLDRALEASRRGFAAWSGMSALARQVVMERAARLMEERRETIARICTLEAGKPLVEARQEVDFVIGVTRWYAEEGKRAYGRIIPSRFPGATQMVMKEPVGPVAAFVAWNFPGLNVIRKVAGALAAGCSIIIKASEETPGTCIAIARCFEEAGLPAGALNVVFGVPDAVSRHLLGSPIPQKVSFTGSVPIGIHLQKLAAETLKRCTLELGGHAPFIVFDDADIDAAARLAAFLKFRNAGQVCVCPSRFFVQRAVFDRFLDAFAARARAISVGCGLDETTEMGPLIAARRIDAMERLVQDAVSRGGAFCTGGERLGRRGFFFAPTVLVDVPDEAAVMREEPFGPIAPVVRFDDGEDVIARANRVNPGLAAYVFTRNGARASMMARRLEAGLVGINHAGISTPESPFGGVNGSGYGSEGGIEGLETFLRVKFVSELRD
ncbi:NAD-dependent succinate-semialdehyde dehydrogenase [Chelatococcus asaccharovorans]|uniref:NAD-dependent succinate-semialdehyde dehydrogenase n=1 Tax=Chelatococcus asaccharovorans TaxID=28210 RepID=UPI00224C6FED|nr:NAD-dependent succinate-semialdehyde dehydrogenase [Chelatococcus asaccharovorans]CAH1665978.1 Alpha-ketoglutaric semialdehyde dehydrogenase 1 [Chelatococcus asaccharovorans]CAH1681690.1 Alpha-ketoglutaric semialdehyde dehydrogenase 1 [Chelatococcus asaccharovorans]